MPAIEQEPQRNSSIRSLRSLVAASLRKVTTANSQKSDAPPAEPPVALDDLPQTREGLEARLNYHLSELDRIRILVVQRNEEINELSYRAHAQQRLRDEIPRSVQKLKELHNHVRGERDSYACFVDYHRLEIRRIAKQREELDLSQGIQSATKDMYRSLEREKEWILLFSV